MSKESPQEIRGENGAESKVEQWWRRAEEIESELHPPFNNAEALRAFGDLAFKLERHLVEHDVLLSDDVGGRLPTLLIRRLAALKRAKESGEESESWKKIMRFAPDTYFVAGGGQLKEEFSAYNKKKSSEREKRRKKKTAKVLKEKIKEFAEENKEEWGRALLITETIDTGGSIKKMIEILQDVGIDVDVAAVSAYEVPTLHDLEGELSIKIFYGSEGFAGDCFHHEPGYDQEERIKSAPQKATGVIKPALGEGITGFPRKSFLADKELVDNVREDVVKIADELKEVMRG